MLGRSLGCPNSYWPSAHPGSLGRLSGALNSHWLSGDSSLLRDFLGCGEAKGAPEDALMSMADCRGITIMHRGITRIHRGITRMHRGITIIHSGAGGAGS